MKNHLNQPMFQKDARYNYFIMINIFLLKVEIETKWKLSCELLKL